MECVMLCGIPTSGKSTYVDKLLRLDYWQNSVVLSTDYYIEFYAKQQGKTYNEVFDEYVKEATKQMDELLQYAIKNNKHIIWDQTNLTTGTRKKKLRRVPPEYHCGVIYFQLSLEEALERNNHRKGKFIPKDILKRMWHQFEVPIIEEGFEYVECGT
jgi:tRNA uridine 5-carbamoylmethylation protein Kti12